MGRNVKLTPEEKAEKLLAKHIRKMDQKGREFVNRIKREHYIEPEDRVYPPDHEFWSTR